jgi:hypothetical protein
MRRRGDHSWLLHAGDGGRHTQQAEVRKYTFWAFPGPINIKACDGHLVQQGAAILPYLIPLK